MLNKLAPKFLRKKLSQKRHLGNNIYWATGCTRECGDMSPGGGGVEDIFRREDPILLAIPEYISEKVWGGILTHPFTIKIRVLEIFYAIISAK